MPHMQEAQIFLQERSLLLDQRISEATTQVDAAQKQMLTAEQDDKGAWMEIYRNRVAEKQQLLALELQVTGGHVTAADWCLAVVAPCVLEAS